MLYTHLLQGWIRATHPKSFTVLVLFVLVGELYISKPIGRCFSGRVLYVHGSCFQMEYKNQRCFSGKQPFKTILNGNKPTMFSFPSTAWPTFPEDFSFERLRADLDENAECVLVYERADYREWSSYSFCNRG